ncbi:hypothetical protein [Micromonospora sp. B9E7]|uniref:hypothetical protein n=1 Tax=Micromonospora sp. B9E7 TaxID=3153574 RepID=UPI00325CF041
MTGPASAQVSTPTETRGRVQVSGTNTYFGGTSPFTDDDTFVVTGVATAAGEGVTFRPATN